LNIKPPNAEFLILPQITFALPAEFPKFLRRWCRAHRADILALKGSNALDERSIAPVDNFTWDSRLSDIVIGYYYLMVFSF